MEPAAAEIESNSRRPGKGPRATTKSGTSLDDQTFHARLVKAPGGCDARRSAADDHRFEITICHF
jgi:hypothetical protein